MSEELLRGIYSDIKKRNVLADLTFNVVGNSRPETLTSTHGKKELHHRYPQGCGMGLPWAELARFSAKTELSWLRYKFCQQAGSDEYRQVCNEGRSLFSHIRDKVGWMVWFHSGIFGVCNCRYVMPLRRSVKIYYPPLYCLQRSLKNWWE